MYRSPWRRRGTLPFDGVVPTSRLRTIALLARTPGLLVLKHALLRHPALDVSAVVTHGRLPKAEGGGDRSDVDQFRDLCHASSVPLIIADGAEARAVGGLLPKGPLDLLVSLSWRYVVPKEVLDRFAWGCLNVHRGALPKYAGAIPVQRAIEAGDTRFAITAHEMTPEIDAGETIAQVWLEPDSDVLLGESSIAAEQVKTRLEPLYAPLVTLALESRLASGRG